MQKRKPVDTLIDIGSHFRGFPRGYFLCPVFLKTPPPEIRKQNPVSRAHIIPKAAGGKQIHVFAPSAIAHWVSTKITGSRRVFSRLPSSYPREVSRSSSIWPASRSLKKIPQVDLDCLDTDPAPFPLCQDSCRLL